MSFSASDLEPSVCRCGQREILLLEPGDRRRGPEPVHLVQVLVEDEHFLDQAFVHVHPWA